MDIPPITFTGTLSEQEAVDMHRCRSLYQMRPSIRWLIGVFSALMVATLVTVLLLGGFNLTLCVFLGCFVYFPTAWWYYDRFSTRKQYRLHPESFPESTVTITPVDVSLSNANYSIRLNWNQFSLLLNTPKGLLFVIPPFQVLCWLPQRLFEDNDYKKAILVLAFTNNIRIRSMK